MAETEVTFNNLGEVLIAIVNKGIGEGDVLTNLSTGERVIVKEGSLHFLTFNDYVSNEVPLVHGMVTAQWELEKKSFNEVTLAEALEAVVRGTTVYLDDRTKVDSVADLLEEAEHIIDVSDSKLENLVFRVKADDAEPNKHARKTTKTEAWAILMDYNFELMSAKNIADKYGVSLRTVYYILDGTFYAEVYERFNQLVEAGELYFERD